MEADLLLDRYKRAQAAPKLDSGGLHAEGSKAVYHFREVCRLLRMGLEDLEIGVGQLLEVEVLGSGLLPEQPVEGEGARYGLPELAELGAEQAQAQPRDSLVEVLDQAWRPDHVVD
jgi:hypothetical protein